MKTSQAQSDKNMLSQLQTNTQHKYGNGLALKKIKTIFRINDITLVSYNFLTV